MSYKVNYYTLAKIADGRVGNVEQDRGHFFTDSKIEDIPKILNDYLEPKKKIGIIDKIRQRTYYYVQVQREGENPQIVYHTYDEEEKKYYHKFFDRKKAKALAEAEKKITPNEKFRVVKCTETYDTDPWF